MNEKTLKAVRDAFAAETDDERNEAVDRWMKLDRESRNAQYAADHPPSHYVEPAKPAKPTPDGRVALEERVAFAELARDNMIAQRDEARAQKKASAKRAGQLISELRDLVLWCVDQMPEKEIDNTGDYVSYTDPQDIAKKRLREILNRPRQDVES